MDTRRIKFTPSKHTMETRKIKFTPTKDISQTYDNNDWKKYILEEKDPPGFTVKTVNDYIGKGVFVIDKKPKGSFLFEYAGELISKAEALHREKKYPRHLGSYLFFFKSGTKEFCVDATFSKQLGRFVNDGIGSTKNAELRVVILHHKPHLCIFATRHLHPGEEIRFNYGVNNLPWRLENSITSSIGQVGLTRKKHNDTKNNRVNMISSVGAETCTDINTMTETGQQYLKTDGNKGNKRKFNLGSNDACALDSTICQTTNVNKVTTKKDKTSLLDTDGYNEELYATPLSSISSQMENVNQVSANHGGLCVNNTESRLYQCNTVEKIHNDVSDDGSITLMVTSNSDKVPESTSTHLNQTSSKAIAHGGTHIQTSITKTGEESRLYQCYTVEQIHNDVSDDGSITLMVTSKSDNVPESTSTHLNQTSSKAIAHGGAHIKTSITKTGEESRLYQCNAVEQIHNDVSDDESITLMVTSESDNVPESTSTHLNQTSSKAIAHRGAHFETSITKTGEGPSSVDSGVNGIMGAASELKQGSVMDILGGFSSSKPSCTGSSQTASEKTFTATLISVPGIGSKSDLGESVVSNTAETKSRLYQCNAVEQIHNDVSDDGSITLMVTSTSDYVPESTSTHLNQTSSKAIEHRGTRIQSSTTKTRKGKPKRPCPFCGFFSSKLPDHMKSQHKTEKEVIEAMKLPKKEQANAFADLRKKGIYLENMKQIRNGSKTNLIRERQQGNDDIVSCSVCKAFLSKTSFYKHKKICQTADKETISSAINVTVLQENKGGKYVEYTAQVLSRFRDNDVGNMCRSEQHIIEFGFHQYIAKGSKHNKEAEKKKSLMTMLRQIAKLFLDFKDTYKHRTKKDCISITEMFIRDNFEYLKEVLQCRKDSANDLNLSLGYAMKKFAKFLHDKYTTVGKDEQANEHMKFHHILTHNWPILFGEMEYQAVIARTNTRKPKELPEEEDVKILMNYMQNQITELTSDRYKFTSSDEFATLRNVLLCRVTLFNARRGGEPSRLTLQQWAEAENGDWVGNFEDSGLLDEDREILKTMKVAYQTGKRDDSLVPVLFPDDTITGLRMIADPEIRKDGGVNKYNKFLFPSTNLSDKHVNGSDSIRAVCTKAGVNTITATKFRHRVSTKYAQIETNKQHRDAFFRHMGHSDSINRNVYQCPPAVIEVTKVGRFLQNIDSEAKNGRCNQEIDSQSKVSGSHNDSAGIHVAVASKLKGSDHSELSSSQLSALDDADISTSLVPRVEEHADENSCHELCKDNDADRVLPKPTTDNDSVPKRQCLSSIAVIATPVNDNTVRRCNKLALIKAIPRLGQGRNSAPANTKYSVLKNCYPVPVEYDARVILEKISIPANEYVRIKVGQKWNSTNINASNGKVKDQNSKRVQPSVRILKGESQNNVCVKQTDNVPEVDAFVRTQQSQDLSRIGSVVRVQQEKQSTAVQDIVGVRLKNSAPVGNVFHLSNSHNTALENRAMLRKPSASVNDAFQDTMRQDGNRTPADNNQKNNSDKGSTQVERTWNTLCRKERRYTVWRNEDTQRLNNYFSRTVHDISRWDPKGNLPGYAEIRKFINCNPDIHADIPLAERLKVIHAKLFNERNKSRRMAKRYSTQMK